jgi:hypothetical protein
MAQDPARFFSRWLFLMRASLVEMLAGAALGVVLAVVLGFAFGSFGLVLLSAIGAGIGTVWGLRRKGLWPDGG